MKKILSLALLFILISPALQAKNLRLVATVPELADIASRIGGQWVHVDTIARGTEDIHQVIMRPSLVPKINSADALIFLGLTIEHSFLPGLLTVSANPQMRADVVKQCLGTGCIDCSEGVAVLQKMANLSRSEGEFHPFGNPHYNLEPDNGVIMARNIAAGLSRIDAAHAADYEKNLREYLAELNAKLIEWRRQVAPLKGLKAVSYHQDVVYLGRFTGLDFIGTLEPKPGIAPTPAHLEALVETMKQQHVTLIIREQQYDPKMPEFLASKTGARVAVIATMAKALPGTDTFISLSEHNLQALLNAAEKKP